MNARRLLAAFVLVATMLATLSSEQSFAQSGVTDKVDRRVEEVLERTGWKYEIDSDGDFRLHFRFSDGRTQVVFVRSKTEDVDGLEVRAIWSPGIRVTGGLDQRTAIELLRENDRVEIGAWRLIDFPDFPDGCVAIFVVQIGAETDRETLMTAVRVAGLIADRKEKATTERDDL